MATIPFLKLQEAYNYDNWHEKIYVTIKQNNLTIMNYQYILIGLR